MRDRGRRPRARDRDRRHGSRAATLVAFLLSVKAPASALAVILLSVTAPAPALAETLGLRQPALSPDGARLAFVAGGDIWTVPSNGGEAAPLVVSPFDDRRPVWSPDGGTLAFASRRDGDYDLYVVRTGGEGERRLTWAPADDWPTGFTPDGREVLFHSRRGDGRSRIYRVPVTGGEPAPITNDESQDGVLSPDGGTLAFTAGALPWWRTSSRGPATHRLLVLHRLDGLGARDGVESATGAGARAPEAERVAPGTEQQLWPQWFPDGRRLLFVSSASLIGNLWTIDLASGERLRLTDHTEESVRFPSLAADGSRVAYEHQGRIVVRKLRGRDQEPHAVPITLPVEAGGPLPIAISLREGVERIAVDPSGKRLAVEVRGEIFLCDLPSEGKVASLRGSAILGSPWREAHAAFSPDGTALLYDGDEGGQRAIRLLESLDAPGARSATTRVSSGEADAAVPIWSPDARYVVFVRREGGEALVLADAGGGRERVLLRARRIHGFAFHPGGEWLACVSEGDGGRLDLLLLAVYAEATLAIASDPAPMEAPSRPEDESSSTWFVDGSPRWSPDGALLAYVADAGGSRRVRVLAFAGERGTIVTEDATSPGFQTETTRAVSVRPATIPEPPGEVAAIAFATDGSNDLLVAEAHGAQGSLWRLASTGDAARRLATCPLKLVEVVPLTDGKTVLCRSAFRQILRLDEAAEGLTPVELEGAISIDRREEFRQIFLEAARLLEQRFYDPAMHLQNWSRTRERLERRLDACRTVEELREIILMAEGELEASHCNLELAAGAAGPPGGDLGLDAREAPPGAGLLVERVVPGGPAALAAPSIRRGDRLLALDASPLADGCPMESLLAGAAGREIRLDVESAAGERRSVLLVAIDAAARSRLEEEEIDRERASCVQRGSGGRAVYLHLRAIDEAAVSRLGAVFTAEADREPGGLILDLRENRGGYGMDALLSALARRPWAELRRRGEPGRSWPSGARAGQLVLLFDATTASAAELVALGARELGLGTLVGETTQGALIASSEERLIDGSRFQLPVAGWYTLDGASLENRGVEPDILAERRWGAGAAEDRALDAAIRAIGADPEPRGGRGR